MRTKTTIRQYIKASTPDKLIEMQLKNNMLLGASFDYEIMKSGKDWYAWFEADISVVGALERISSRGIEVIDNGTVKK